MFTRFDAISVAMLAIALITCNGSLSSAQTIDWNVDLDEKFEGSPQPNPSLADGVEPGVPEPLPEPSDSPVAAAAWIGPTGLVVHDTDDSHVIDIYYSQGRSEIVVQIFDYASTEILRRRFLTADVEAAIAMGHPIDPGACRIYCYGGHDEVHYRLALPSRIEGGSGDDELFGGSDQDVLSGGPGTDRLFGGSGNDFINGDEGGDFLQGEGGWDIFDGGTGSDIINANDGFGGELITGGAGGDIVFLDWLDSAGFRVAIDLFGDFDPQQDQRF